MSASDPTADQPIMVKTSDGEKAGATAAFPYDRMTVERFRASFPRARWRDDLRAWFVPGTTAERRLNRWIGREFSGAVTYGDEKGRDAFAFDPIQSSYLEAGDDLRIRTPYSRKVIEELRSVPWAWWDSEMKAWRVPYRSFDALRERWPAIETAARRNEPVERQKRREARDAETVREMAAHAAESRRRRYPVPVDFIPPLERVVMTAFGAVIFKDVTGELVDDEWRERFYPDVSEASGPLVWASWYKPAHEQLVKAWPAPKPATVTERARGWWQPDIDELRDERRKARAIERARKTRLAREGAV